jgi:hypothetical protein
MAKNVTVPKGKFYIFGVFCHLICESVLTCFFYASAISPGLVVWASSAADTGDKVRTV